MGAQTIAAPVAPVEPQIAVPTLINHSTPELNHIRDLFMQGLYLQLIDKATNAMQLDKDKGQAPDPELLYWRGFARRRCGLFDGAQADLKPLGNVTGWPRFLSAAELSKELDVLLEQRPPHEHEIREGDNVIFRVYYNDDDEFFHTIVDALPKGYQAASTLIGLQTQEIPVFIFNSAHYAEFVKFFTSLSQGPLQGWWRIGNLNGTITISQNNVLEPPLLSNCPDMARLMSHEITHQLIHHIVGDLQNFPAWFNEGTARCGEGTYKPEFYAQNDQKIKQLVEEDAIIPLSQLVSARAFYHSVDQMKKGVQQGDAYAQGFSMTRYLGTLLKGQKLGDFLDDVQEKQSFDAALKQETGMTPSEFYQSWLDEISDEHR
ncbi:MAG: hypothetical protein EOP06_11005 [Proteobacteria bacterium]|nr:MAG: hypothetical protein EOP06_11005 [Pseudomonadota bacterium]